jgi:DNA-binding NarL/FixJ family response regulator
MAHTLLIVDDHAAFRSTARALLECDGWDVVGEAGDGTSGLTAARTLKPDVVLLDVRLPDIDGFAVAERLAADGGGPAVIVTSSSDDPLYPDRARRTGARGFLAKHDLSGAALQRVLDEAAPPA